LEREARHGCIGQDHLQRLAGQLTAFRWAPSSLPFPERLQCPFGVNEYTVAMERTIRARCNRQAPSQNAPERLLSRFLLALPGPFKFQWNSHSGTQCSAPAPAQQFQSRSSSPERVPLHPALRSRGAHLSPFPHALRKVRAAITQRSITQRSSCDCGAARPTSKEIGGWDHMASIVIQRSPFPPVGVRTGGEKTCTGAATNKS
jgi:hypothetical protein